MDSSEIRTNYSFTIHNKSGGPQCYSLFSHPPQVEPPVDNLVSHALLVARGVPSSTGVATLVIQSDNFYAICGTMYQDEGAQMYVLDRQPVRLGSRPFSGVGQKAGTTVVLKVVSGSPCFGPWQGNGHDVGKQGAFCLQTEDFKLIDAKNNRYMAAFGLKTTPNAQVGVHASFTPAPNTMYQIIPSKVYYLLPVAFATNEPKPAEVDLSQALRIDLSLIPAHVEIIHDNDNILALSAEPSPLTPKI